MKPTDMPICNPSIGFREDYDDWAILFDPDTSEAVGINPVAVEVWKKLDGTHTLNDLIREVRSAFTEVPETVEDDVNSFLDILTQKGFVTVS